MLALFNNASKPKKLSFFCFDKIQLITAVLALPTCKYPDGLGANLSGMKIYQFSKKLFVIGYLRSLPNDLLEIFTPGGA